MLKTAHARRGSVFKVLLLTACLGAVAWSSAAVADGSSQPYGAGGPYYPTFDSVIRQYNRSGELFRIEGHCQSNCTTFLSIRNVCVEPDATLLFHANQNPRERNQPPDPKKNQSMLSHYNARLRNFVVANHYMDSFEFHSISGRDIIQRFGYRQCPRR
jgi:hypothetical protein